MADYYSATSRAVAALESYQLGKRPFNKRDFDRERLMLEDAISRVEIEATSKRITTEASPVQPSDIGPIPMTPLPPLRSWLKRALDRIWQDGPFHQALRNNSGGFAILAAIRRAPSLLSSLAADLRPGSSS
jgi:hypothetical protein